MAKIPQEKIAKIVGALIENPACADKDGIVRFNWVGGLYELRPKKKEKKRDEI